MHMSNVNVIILLYIQTSKCQQYWPDQGQSLTYGDVKVTCNNQLEYVEYTYRTFDIRKVNMILIRGNQRALTKHSRLYHEPGRTSVKLNLKH